MKGNRPKAAAHPGNFPGSGRGLKATGSLGPVSWPVSRPVSTPVFLFFTSEGRNFTFCKWQFYFLQAVWRFLPSPFTRLSRLRGFIGNPKKISNRSSRSIIGRSIVSIDGRYACARKFRLALHFAFPFRAESDRSVTETPGAADLPLLAVKGL